MLFGRNILRVKRLLPAFVNPTARADVNRIHVMPFPKSNSLASERHLGHHAMPGLFRDMEAHASCVRSLVVSTKKLLRYGLVCAGSGNKPYGENGGNFSMIFQKT
jgi:hypothetical protein